MIHNIVSALNWGIAKDEPLHQALKGLAGKRLRIVFPIGGSVDWEIEADGLLKEVGVQTKYSTASTSGISSAPKAPDVTITIQTDLSKGLRIEGDAIVAEKLGPLVKLMKIVYPHGSDSGISLLPVFLQSRWQITPFMSPILS